MKSFDPTAAQSRLDRLWNLKAAFGMERGALHAYLHEIVSDRYTLVNGLQLLRDELQLARGEESDVVACGADLSLPTVLSTLAHTNCGDRVHQGEATITYEQVVASRFATMSEIGELKLEAFSPTGGGTDDGATLAHVTVAHAIDKDLQARLYEGNAQSFILACIDLKTHVGRYEEGSVVTFGTTRESPWRESRAACGAIVGALRSYDRTNNVHQRIREDLGEENFQLLSRGVVRSREGHDLSAAVGAAIVAVQGMRNTAFALSRELDERLVGHLTASVTVNRVSRPDPVIYLARACTFRGEVRCQGFGTDARKYGGHLVEHEGDQRLVLTYDGRDPQDFPIGRLDETKTTRLHAPHEI